MTRQMTDDEVLRVLDLAYYAVPDNRGDLAEQLHQVGRYVAALQAERDALRAEVEMHRTDATRLNGCPWRVQKGLQSECQPPKNMRESLAALEALRGQVAGLVAHAEGRTAHRYLGECPDAIEGHESRDPDCGVCNALLAIKERMG